MSLFAPLIAGASTLIAGLAVLIWMNRNQPTMQSSPANESEPQSEPSPEGIWRGKIAMPETQRGYEAINVHHE
jgi:hypothetical protein